MEDDNLLAEVRIRSVIRMERSLRSEKRMTEASARLTSRLKVRSFLEEILSTTSYFDVMDTYLPACEKCPLVCRNIINEVICWR